MSSKIEIKDVEPEIQTKLKKQYSGPVSGFIRVGSIGCLMLSPYRYEAQKIYDMPLRETDIFIAGYARSGTTMTQELVWMVANELDFQGAAATPLSERYVFLERSMFIPSEDCKSSHEEVKPELAEKSKQRGSEQVAQLPTTTVRFMKTHLPLSLLPPGLLDTARMVYLARDPRDVAVSFYHLHKSGTRMVYIEDFKTFWNYFIQDLQLWTPYFENLKEAWAKRDHPNMLFLFYEEIIKDMSEAIRRVATFLKKQLSEDQIKSLCEHMHIDNFKKNKSVNHEDTDKEFIRQGKTGGWRDYFDQEMMKQADEWMKKNLCDTDFRFPHLEDIF